MKIFDKIRAYFKAKRKKPFPQSKHVINHAFTVGGVDYFEFDTTANLPFKRGLKFLSIYNELDMKVDRFFLNAHTDAIEKILTGGKRVGFDEMMKIRTLNQQLKERLTWIYQEDLVYKIASVVFFDANENPDDWEWGYALKKIEHWKKHESVATFFLHEPIQRLIPFLKDSALSILTYSQTQKELDKAQLESLLEILSDSPKIDSLNYTNRYFSEEMKRSSA